MGTTGRTIPVETFAESESENATFHRKSGASFYTDGCLQRAPVRLLRCPQAQFPRLPRPGLSPQFQSPAARLFFLESTIFTTTISVATTNCAYSTAALGACSGRKRRGITADDQEFAIDAAPIQRVMATQVAEMDDVRQKRQFLREDFSYDPSAIASSHYYEEPKVTHYLNMKDGGRFLFNVRTATSTVTSYSVVTASTLVTCTGVFNVC